MFDTGDPAASELLRRIKLPADDFEHMPATGESLPPDTIATLRIWIEGGAVWPEGFETDTHWETTRRSHARECRTSRCRTHGIAPIRATHYSVVQASVAAGNPLDRPQRIAADVATSKRSSGRIRAREFARHTHPDCFQQFRQVVIEPFQNCHKTELVKISQRLFQSGVVAGEPATFRPGMVSQLPDHPVGDGLSHGRMRRCECEEVLRLNLPGDRCRFDEIVPACQLTKGNERKGNMTLQKRVQRQTTRHRFPQHREKSTARQMPRHVRPTQMARDQFVCVQLRRIVG